jgi:hypothetical protein
MTLVSKTRVARRHPRLEDEGANRRPTLISKTRVQQAKATLVSKMRVAAGMTLVSKTRVAIRK